MKKTTLEKTNYAFMLLKLGGLKSFMMELRNQIYSKKTYIGTVMDLDAEIIPVPSKLEYLLKQASKEDMKEVFQMMALERKLPAVEMLKRKLCYKFGFHNCYVARTTKSNELCYVIWVMTQEENDLLCRLYKNRFPILKEGDILFENRYTFEKFRGNRIAPSVDVQLCEMAKRNGFKRQLGYISSDNIPSLKAAETACHKPFEQVQICKFLFSVRRKSSTIGIPRVTDN